MRISIFGCGWLGKQLASALLSEGHELMASYRKIADQAALKQMGLHPVLLDDLKSLSAVPPELTRDVDVAIITFPPPKAEFANYLKGFSVLIDALSTVPRVIYTSSTGVYPNVSGTFLENYSFSEVEKRDPRLELERCFSNRIGGDSIILRLGGLIGPGRHPLNSLSGKVLKSDGGARVNLIAGSDVVQLLKNLIAMNEPPTCLNVSYPLELSKKDYYSSLAMKWDLDPPVFGQESDPDRRINTNLFAQLMGVENLSNPLNFDRDR